MVPSLHVNILPLAVALVWTNVASKLGQLDGMLARIGVAHSFSNKVPGPDGPWRYLAASFQASRVTADGHFFSSVQFIWSRSQTTIKGICR